jgi:hypothetical protein
VGSDNLDDYSQHPFGNTLQSCHSSLKGASKRERYLGYRSYNKNVFACIASDLIDILSVPVFGMPITKIGVGSGSLRRALKVSGLLVKLLVDSLVGFDTSSVEFDER